MTDQKSSRERVQGPYLLLQTCIMKRRPAAEVHSSMCPLFCWWSLWGQQSLLVSWAIQIYLISGLFFLVLFQKSRFKTLGLTCPSFSHGWHICCLAGNLGDFCRHFKWGRLCMWEEKNWQMRGTIKVRSAGANGGHSFQTQHAIIMKGV